MGNSNGVFRCPLFGFVLDGLAISSDLMLMCHTATASSVNTGIGSRPHVGFMLSVQGPELKQREGAPQDPRCRTRETKAN